MGRRNNGVFCYGGQSNTAAPSLKRSYDKGYKKGFEDAAPFTEKAVYAAIVIAAHEKLGFGQKRCAEFLNAVNDIVVNALTTEELMDSAFDMVGLRIDFDSLDGVVEYKEEEK